MADKLRIVLGVVLLLMAVITLVVVVQALENETTINPIDIINDTTNTKIPIEIISKRTYDSQTFDNKDRTYTTILFGGNIFFYDGKEYQYLKNMTDKPIEKKEIILDKIPENNLFDIEVYLPYKGITYELDKEGNLLFKDANGKNLGYLSRPFSIDSKNDVIKNDYVLNVLSTSTKEFQLKVQVDRKWLDNAIYPVTIDPTIILNATSGIYDGDIQLNSLGGLIRNTNSPSFNVGCKAGSFLFNPIFHIFIEFNASSIPDSAFVSDVILNLTVETVNADFLQNNISISRINNSQFSNNITYPDNLTGNYKLFNDTYGTGNPHYIINSTSFQTVGNKTFDLGTTADSDLINQLSVDYFSVGLYSTSENCPGTSTINRYVSIYSSEDVINTPKLIATYNSPCPLFISGDQYCNTTCTYVNQQYVVPGDLYVQDGCTLTLGGNSKFYFADANRYIYVYKGGTIYFNDTSELSSATAP